MAVTKDCAVMKASFEDEIYSTPKESKTICSIKGDNAVCSWSTYSIQTAISYKELKILIPSIIFWPGFADRVVDNIYYYNSKVDIIKNDEGHNLLILRDSEIVIDLFNFTREMFVGESKTDEYIEEILKEIGCESFVFLSLKEAIMANDIFRHTDNEIILNKGVISQGGSLFGEELWRFTLTKLFHGKHNWASNISYLAMKEQLKDSIYPYQVMCYESSSYIREDKDFIIEVDASNEIDSLEIVPIVIFSLNKQNASDIQLLFHGLFELDKNRSLKDNHVTFKCIKSNLKV